jgi:Domain of unknown function (DUF4126)
MWSVSRKSEELMNTMEILLSICLGIGLSAACGFRIFVPPLIVSIASMAGHIKLTPGFEWMSTYPAMIAFALATVLEIGAYYIPWLDNLLDHIATPTAIIAGILMSASVIGGVSPFLKWTLAVIAGGGAAGIIQGFTIVTRAASTVTTGGLANALVSSGEAVGSVFLSVITIILPVLAVAMVFAFACYALMKLMQKKVPAR